MQVVAPIQVTDATLTSVNVSETDNPEWDPSTSYPIGAAVMVSVVEPDIHKNYESLVGANLGNQPWTDDGTNWLELGPTNAWAMFDNGTSTQTTNPESIVVEVTAGEIINTVALLNISGQSVQIEVTDPIEGLVYDETIQLVSDSGINDWYAYYFTPIDRRTNLVDLNLPAYSAATIRVTLLEPGGTAAIGVLAFGTAITLGETDYGSSVGILQFGRKEIDEFGNFQIVDRGFSDRGDFTVAIEPRRTAYVKRTLTQLRTTPAIWIGDPEFEETFIYGYYRDFDIVLSSPALNFCSLLIEGLT